MKLNKYFWGLGLFAALSLTACSDDAVVEEQGGGFNADGTGYISLAINMPSRNSSSTRADGSSVNDNFDDGTPNEYAIKNATLILFKAGSTTGEKNYTFHSAYDLNLDFDDNTGNQQITKTTVKKTLKISGTNGVPVSALVILNHNNLINVTSSGVLQYKEDKTASFTDFGASNTFGDFLNIMSVKVDQLHKNGFFMTNAVLAYKPGTSWSDSDKNTASILVPIKDSDIYSSMESAESTTTPLEMFVERAVAKVSIEVESDLGQLETGNGEEKLNPSVKTWLLRQVHDKTYLVKHWQNDSSTEANWFSLTSSNYQVKSTESNYNGYRFAGYVPVQNIPVSGGSPGVTLYRTYWAEDPFYGDTESWAESSEAQTEDLETVKYCYENTFPTNLQKVNHTTHALIKVQFTSTTDGVGTADFYLLNGERSKVYRESDMLTSVANKAHDLFGSTSVIPSGTGTIEVNSITFEDEGAGCAPAAASAGVKTIKSLTLKIGENIGTGLNDDQLELLNKSIVIDKYDDSYAYYVVLIKHFGDDLTPWNIDNKVTSGKPYADATDDVSDKNFLGRYGLVRNNWYHLNVTGVTAIGSSTPPTITEDWDDDVATYLACKINILSWAKRTQGVTLQ